MIPHFPEFPSHMIDVYVTVVTCLLPSGFTLTLEVVSAI